MIHKNPAPEVITTKNPPELIPPKNPTPELICKKTTTKNPTLHQSRYMYAKKPTPELTCKKTLH